MAIKELKDFIFENYYRWIRFTKERIILLKKPLFNEISEENIFVIACNLYNRKINNTYRIVTQNIINLIWRNNTKLVKRSKVSTQRPKTIENPSIVDKKSVITEHRKTSHKVSKAVRQAENISQVSGAGK